MGEGKEAPEARKGTWEVWGVCRKGREWEGGTEGAKGGEREQFSI